MAMWAEREGGWQFVRIFDEERKSNPLRKELAEHKNNSGESSDPLNYAQASVRLSPRQLVIEDNV